MSTQCPSVMRLVVWGGVGGHERCKTLWCMSGHCRFLTVKNLPPIEECVVELCGLLKWVRNAVVWWSGDEP